MPSAIRTAEELLRAGDIGRCELVRGKLVMMVPTGGQHGDIAYEIGYRLGEHVRPRKLGKILAAETGFLISRDPDTVRAPDVAFVRAGRVAISPSYVEGPPDLAVEVLSPDDRPGYIREKVKEWLEAGTRLVWVVDPGARTVAVHEPGRKSRVVRESGVLPGGDVLPGFALAVRDIFSPP